MGRAIRTFRYVDGALMTTAIFAMIALMLNEANERSARNARMFAALRVASHHAPTSADDDDDGARTGSAAWWRDIERC